MKAKLAAGEPAFGVSVMFPSPQLVEMLGVLGFNWVLLDCEHGSLSPADVELMAIAAQASGMTPIARPATRGAEHILQVLDRGVLGVQVPHVVCPRGKRVDADRSADRGRGGAAQCRRDARGRGGRRVLRRPVGPLAMMGHPGNASAPRVAQAIEECLARIRAAGKVAGMPSGVDNAGEVLGKGVRYLYTHVPRLLAAAARAHLGQRGRGAAG